MRTRRDDIDLPTDDELERLLHDPSVERDALSLDALFAEVEQQVVEEDAQLGGRLRSLSTVRRRALAILTFLGVIAVALLRGLRSDLEELPLPRLLLDLAALSTLLSTSLFVALRPAHVPSLSSLKVGLLAAITVAAAFTVAALPESHPSPIDPGAALGPCLFIGLATGLPVYAIARVLDRGTHLSAVLAASAAGLAGDLVLELHCPVVSRAHLLANHAPLGLVFLAALGLGALFARRRG